MYKKHFNFASLHPNARGNNMSALSPKNATKLSSRVKHMQKPASEANHSCSSDENDVLRVPESSDEEEIGRLPESSEEEENPPPQSVVTVTSDEAVPELRSIRKSSPKRPAPSSQSTRSSKRIRRDEPETSTLAVRDISEPQQAHEMASSSMIDSLFVSSQSPQKKSKARAKTYGRTKPTEYQELEPLQEPARPEVAPFQHLDCLPVDDDNCHDIEANFQQPPELPKKIAPPAFFSIPDLPDSDEVESAQPLPSAETTSSGLTTTTDTKSAHNRSNSSSSLSSVSSIASIRSNSNIQSRSRRKKDPPFEEILDPLEVRCPLCTKVVTNIVLKSKVPDVRMVTLAVAQQFCYDHTMSDAKAKWKQEKYPYIEWSDLGDNRLDDKLDHLIEIINGSRSCYYLTHLNEAIKATEGNKSALKRHLHLGVLDVAKHGYYGPRGQRIIATALPVRLKRELKSAVSKNKTLQTVGISAFAIAVLVPEMLLRMVMEDLATDDEVLAREVLDDSNEVGKLLNPDIDRVARTREDDDDWVAETLAEI